MATKLEIKQLKRNLLLSTIYIHATPAPDFHRGYQAMAAEALKIVCLSQEDIFQLETQAWEWAQIHCPGYRAHYLSPNRCIPGCHRCAEWVESILKEDTDD